LVTGSLANLRTSHSIYVTAMGTIARELYLFDADPRNTTDLVGNTEAGILDNNSFYTTASWTSRYQTIKNLNIILQALPNAAASVSAEEKLGYEAFANTMKAHQLLILINMQHDNGIRIDVADPANLGPIVTRAEAFTEIATLLNTGYTQLTGAEFAFDLTSGFEGFDTPATFGEFNRALAARVALYRGLYNEALTHLGDSFYDPAGDLSTGPKMIFTTAGPDVLNDLFKAPQQSGNQIIVCNDFIAAGEAGDERVANKTAVRDNPSAKSGLNGTHETRLYAAAISSIDIIRNEELVLINAECQLQNNQLAPAIASLDIIRTNAGLDVLATAKPGILADQAALIDEMLNQRRYSFWGEAHRAIDLRRYGRLNTTYVVTDGVGLEFGEVVFTQFPIPATEN
jgi:starch-binding outer membrane protein, SusD/RagB family